MTGKQQNERFLQHLKTMTAIREAKGKDYANPEDSLANFRSCERVGIPAWVGIWIRLGDKYARIGEQVRKVLNGERVSFSVSSESMTETCLDGANYFLLLDVAFTEWAQETLLSGVERPLIKIDREEQLPGRPTPL